MKMLTVFVKIKLGFTKYIICFNNERKNVN